MFAAKVVVLGFSAYTIYQCLLLLALQRYA